MPAVAATASLPPVLTNVQVLAGATSVARFGDVVAWFETGPNGGGVMLTQMLQAIQAVRSGAVPSPEMGARLAAVLNTGDANAVPAMVAATPEGDGLRVVVHGWGAVVADGLHVPNGWVDQVITDRRGFFVGRNTVTAVAPVPGSALDLEDGVVPGDGVSFAVSPGHGPAMATPAPTAIRAPMAAPVPVAQPAAPSAGRLVLDDGSTAVLERTCVLGCEPHGSPAVQTGVAIPLTVFGAGVAPVHAEIRLEQGGVVVRDLGSATTYVLPPGTSSWLPLAAGQISPLTPGARVALGERTLSYERP